eukprot:CAMPEP_0179303276 /NCGR_PEP_ID=MMETSP0797-20121207/48496_1 /TAXON_ID=47934 /ORGANISM="Dinophysis acuminata, Strain DAEP01" /LENGTH=211 /DNA_ID=CAMNT_0021012831 /DNA_START=42 /DNA_END=677 /DNA_ORIENTATION=-
MTNRMIGVAAAVACALLPAARGQDDRKVVWRSYSSPSCDGDDYVEEYRMADTCSWHGIENDPSHHKLTCTETTVTEYQFPSPGCSESDKQHTFNLRECYPSMDKGTAIMFLMCETGGDHDGDHDGDLDGDEVTCGEVKEAYKENHCCGNPSKPFEMPHHRRLAAKRPAAAGPSPVVDDVRQALMSAHMSGGRKEAAQLAKKIKEALKPFRG